MPDAILAICTPSLGRVRLEWAIQRGQLRTPPAINQITLNAIDYKREGPAAMWTGLIESALAFEHRVLGRVQWIFCVEDDVIPPDDAITRLYYTAVTEGYPVLAGWYRGKNPPYVPIVVARPGSGALILPQREGITEAYCAGLGCVLIRRDVFETIPRPWFEDHPLVIDDAILERGGDVFFAGRCAQQGIPIRVDWGVGCGHVDLETGIVCQPYATAGCAHPVEAVEGAAPVVAMRT